MVSKHEDSDVPAGRPAPPASITDVLSVLFTLASMTQTLAKWVVELDGPDDRRQQLIDDTYQLSRTLDGMKAHLTGEGQP